MHLMDGFFHGSVDLSSINRAHTMLLPKKSGVLPPGG